MKFEHRDDGGLDHRGFQTPAYGFVHGDTFIVDPFASPCGRFRVDPKVYGVSEFDAKRLIRINSGLGVMMPQSGGAVLAD